MKIPEELKVLVLSENGQYSAVDMEYDMAAQGADVQEAIDNLIEVFLTTVALGKRDGTDLFKDRKPAPDWYQEQYLVADTMEPWSFGHPKGTMRTIVVKGVVTKENAV